MLYLSSTKINMFIRCPQQFDFRYNQKLVIPPAVGIAAGKATHKANEINLLNKLQTGEELSFADVKDIAATNYDNVVKDEGIYIPKEVLEEESKTAPQLIGEGKDMCVSCAELYRKEVSPTFMPKSVESKFEVELDKDLIFNGVVDIEDTENNIRDTKTSKKSMTENNLKNSLQLAGYSFNYEIKEKQKPNFIILDVLVKTKIPKVQKLQIPATFFDSEIFLKYIYAIKNSIEKGVFYGTNPDNWWCSPKWCGYYHRCPFRNGKIEYFIM